jgi:hypothetical protein
MFFIDLIDDKLEIEKDGLEASAKVEDDILIINVSEKFEDKTDSYDFKSDYKEEYRLNVKNSDVNIIETNEKIVVTVKEKV